LLEALELHFCASEPQTSAKENLLHQRVGSSSAIGFLPAFQRSVLEGQQEISWENLAFSADMAQGCSKKLRKKNPLSQLRLSQACSSNVQPHFSSLANVKSPFFVVVTIWTPVVDA
jgi:hypothetical protein